MRLWRFLGWPVIGIVIFNAASIAISPALSTFQFEFLSDPPAGVMQGFFASERTPSQLTYAWTRGTFGLRLAGLDRRIRWHLSMRMRAAGPAGRTVDLTATVDDAGVSHVNVPNDFAIETFAIEPSTAGSGARLALSASPTFVPGAGDPRELGVMVDWIRIEPDTAPWKIPTMATSVAGLWFGGITAVFALPAAAAWPLLAVGATGYAVVATRGFAPFLNFPGPPIAVFALLAALAAAVALARTTRAPAAARVVVAMTFAAAYLKLLVLVHPQMPIGDAVFHAHRFEDVLAGKYFFTSITPGEYRFPYAIGLYLVADPFSSFVRGVTAHVVLLRVIVVVVDAFASALLYRAVSQWRQDTMAGVAAVIVYHFLPLSFSVMATGNLTNMFGQSVALIVLVLLFSDEVTGRDPTGSGRSGQRTYARAACLAGIAALALVGFLAHTSTFAVLSGQLLLTSALFLVTRDYRSNGLTLLAITVTAIAVAVAVYYAHFMDVYREAFSRAAAETGQATAAAGGRTPMVRLMDVPRIVDLIYTWTAVVVAAYGATVVARDRHNDAARRLVLVGWVAACFGFFLLGIVTPVDMRHYLAALPVVAMLAGIGFAHAWRAGGFARWVVTGLLLWTAWTGASGWISPIA